MVSLVANQPYANWWRLQGESLVEFKIKRDVRLPDSPLPLEAAVRAFPGLSNHCTIAAITPMQSAFCHHKFKAVVYGANSWLHKLFAFQRLMVLNEEVDSALFPHEQVIFHADSAIRKIQTSMRLARAGHRDNCLWRVFRSCSSGRHR